MKLLTKTSGIEHQALLCGEVFYISESRITNTECTKAFAVNSRMYSIYNNKIILQQKDDKKIYILDSNLDVLKIYESPNGVGHSSVEKLVVIKFDGSLFTLTDNLELEPTAISFMEVYTHSNCIIQREKKTRLHSSSREGQIFWSYSLSEGESIDGSGLKFIDKYGLILTNTTSLIILDLDTGKELHKFEKGPADYIIDSEKLHIIAFGGNSSGSNTLKIIDITSGRLICNKANEYSNLHFTFQPYRSTISKNKLYFVCQNYRPDPNVPDSYAFPHIGRLDLTTYTIDWIEKVGDWKKEGQVFEAPIVINNRIYLRDLSKQAYVYEMEEPNP